MDGRNVPRWKLYMEPSSYNVPKEKILLDYTSDEYEEALNSMPVKDTGFHECRNCRRY